MNSLGSSIILEDNGTTLALANNGEKYRPRTKHLSSKSGKSGSTSKKWTPKKVG
jgi:hypothetical protein